MNDKTMINKSTEFGGTTPDFYWQSNNTAPQEATISKIRSHDNLESQIMTNFANAAPIRLKTYSSDESAA